MAHYEKTGKKGHGCCGGIVVFFLVSIVMVVVLLFTTNVLDSVKFKVMKYFYPQDYSQYVTVYADEYGVDESLVYAVMRTESGFRAEVESSAGAVGLMQIMPETFEWLQNLMSGEITYDSSSLLNPEINIKYGTYFLSYLLKHYSGNEQLAVASYNAGVANVDKWLESEQYSADGVTLSNIPFEETKNYVERVEKTKQVYETLYYDNN